MNKTLRNLALVALVAAPVSAFAEIQGTGTAADPYQIATADDLTNACKKVFTDTVNNTIYFVQTTDIDMAGVKNYFAVNGTYGDYTHAIVYDGQNHVIKNFAPDYVADGGTQGYYNGSIFGVLTGKVMNLGVVDANVDMKGENKTAGILGAYVGHGSVLNKDEFATTYVENVYVTGTIKAGNYNTDNTRTLQRDGKRGFRSIKRFRGSSQGSCFKGICRRYYRRDTGRIGHS